MGNGGVIILILDLYMQMVIELEITSVYQQIDFIQINVSWIP